VSTPSAAISREAQGGGRSRRSLLRDGATLLLRYGMVVVLVVLVVVTIILDSTFLDGNNLLNLLLQWAPVGLMAIGMTYVIISGGFDLSVGGIYAGAAVLYAAMANEGIPIALCVIGVLAAGVAAGAVNGGIITRLEVNPFVATLGMGFILRGLALVLTSAAPIIVADQGFQAIGAGKWGPFPIPGVALVLALLLFGFVLARTVYGRSIYAIGGGDEAARLSGLRTRALRSSAYMLSGFMAALAGVIIAARLGSGQADIGANIELDVITVVVVGGTALTGGEGAMWRTAVGIGILAVLGNAFDRLQVDTFWQLVIKGAIIVVAIAADSYTKRRGEALQRTERAREMEAREQSGAAA
jgi:ribose/xylose/arabinose/galactoside ABC-type transport system permease subunit